MLEKGVICCCLIGERMRDGRRKEGGDCSVLLDWRTLRTAGRKTVGVDISGG